MQNNQTNPVVIEWVTLQNQYDAFEKLSLLIKLFAILLTAVLVTDIQLPELVLALNAILWVQDAIWKTVQSRFGNRLLTIENELAQAGQGTIAFNTAWESQPRGLLILLSEYVRHLVKPTVAFPHALLFCITCYVIF